MSAPLSEHDDDVYTTPAAPTRVVMFATCLVVLLAGFGLMGYGMQEKSGVLFSAGLLASGVAFMVPLGGRS